MAQGGAPAARPPAPAAALGFTISSPKTVYKGPFLPAMSHDSRWRKKLANPFARFFTHTRLRHNSCVAGSVTARPPLKAAVWLVKVELCRQWWSCVCPALRPPPCMCVRVSPARIDCRGDTYEQVEGGEGGGGRRSLQQLLPPEKKGQKGFPGAAHSTSVPPPLLT